MMSGDGPRKHDAAETEPEEFDPMDVLMESTSSGTELPSVEDAQQGLTSDEPESGSDQSATVQSASTDTAGVAREALGRRTSRSRGLEPQSAKTVSAPSARVWPGQVLTTIPRGKLLAGLVFLSVVPALVMVLQFWNDERIPTWPASGRVSFPDGTPVKTGIIELESDAHNVTSSGRIQEDGGFVLGTYETNDGALEGEHAAIVVQMIIDDGTISHTRDHGRPVADSYRRYETSGLTVRIEPRDNRDIEIILRSRNTSERSPSMK